MPFESLFQPLTVRDLTIPNRVIMSAMGSLMIGRDKKVSAQLIDYLTARAEGGVGLIYTPCCGVHDPSTPEGFLGIGTDEIAESHKALTEAVHKAGGKIGIQLLQGSLCAVPAKVYIPSDMPVSEEVTLPGMTKEDIAEITQAFADAAKRAVDAGYDVIEIHNGHSYLQHLFMNPAINRRTDEYGGSFENRILFPLEVIKAVRAVMPEDMPLSIRMDSRDDGFEQNLTIEDMIAFAKQAGACGVDILSVSRGNALTEAMKINVPPVDVPQGFNVSDAERIHRETGMLTAIAGRINHPEMADTILREGKVDLVVMARAQIADPEFCNKAKAGRTDEINYCIGCNQGCFDPNMIEENRYTDTHITCLRNPAVGREKEYRFVKTETPKNVLIIGGGMGGLEAAYRLTMRGHHATLCEASDHLGGQFILAGETPRKGEFKQAALDNAARAQRVGADIRLNTPVTPEMIEQMKPDAVIIAIGAEPINIKLPGAEKKPVCNSHEVLGRKVKPEGVVGIIGGGMVGLETSELIASYGNKVKVIEMQPQLAADMGILRKWCTLENMQKEGIETFVGTRCVAITDEGILVEKDGEQSVIACDSVVMAIGSRSRSTDALKEKCEALGIEHYVIGDAVKARRALNATAEGAEIAYKI